MPFEWWKKPRKISVVVDNDSWILPYAQEIVRCCNEDGDNARLCRTHSDVEEGAVAFYLGCVKITPPDILARNKRNLVVHESDLPKGRGFAPLTWQILEGKKDIPICLLEAAENVDAGPIIYRDLIQTRGYELCDELRAMQGKKSVDLCLRFLKENEPPSGEAQTGAPGIYKRRQREDSRLDPEKTIAEQFELLRVVDNERYPAFFEYRGQRYRLSISKDGGK